MKLSAEQFADLAASFHPEYLTKGRTERRRAPRLELESSLAVRLLNGGKLERAVDLRVHDFSSRGLALLHRTRLSPGTQFVVQMERHSGGCVVMLCTVMHTRQVRDGLFKIGAEFTCQLGEHPGRQACAEVVDEQLRRVRESVLD